MIIITNDTNTLNGALMELGSLMAENLTTQGLIGVSASDGLTTLANDILLIQGGGGSTVIYEDDCSVDNTSDYGSSISLRNSGSSTLAYNSNGYYTITNNGSGKESFIPITDLTGTMGDFTLEYDSYVEQIGGSSGLVVYNSSTSWEKLTDDADSVKGAWYGYNDGSFHETKYTLSDYSYQKWVHYKYTFEDDEFSIKITYNDTVLWSHTETMQTTRGSSTQYGLDSEWQNNTTTRYKNIIVKTLGSGSDCSQYTTQISNAIEYINGSGS